jgi:ABC-type multidrug transport system fused ATPase/permease subunit
MIESKNGKFWLKKQIEPYRKSITLITFMTVLGTAFSVLFAYLVSYVVDSATNKDNDKLLIFSLVILALLLARIGLRAINVYYTEKCRVKISTGD